MLEGALRYAVALDAEDEAAGGVQWELSDLSTAARLLSFTLGKKSPIPGSFIWWKNVFPGDPEIDVSAIQGRAGNLASSAEWEKAHEMFREKIAGKVQEVIEDSSDCDGAEMGRVGDA